MKRQLASKSVLATAEFLALLAGCFFVLYSTALGSAHLARYMIFVMPPFVLVSVLGARWLWELPGTMPFVPGGRPGRAAVFVFAAALCVVFGIETRARLELGTNDELRRAMRAPSERKSYSDSLYAALGAPTELPIVVAAGEVQMRYWLDDRFVVRSLDGRTDPKLLQFVTRNRFDHIGYIKACNIRFLLSTENENRDPGAWSLAELDKLAPGESVMREGLAFRRLPGSQPIFRVDPVR
jgi:hypothetical protein